MNRLSKLAFGFTGLLATTRFCSVEGCDRQHLAKGYCNLHYQRMRRHGEPLIFKGNKSRAWIAALLSGPPTEECVPWPFGGSGGGYGRVQVDKRKYVASRYICEAAHGVPPTPKHEAAHSCGSGHLGCVNPLHLRWATPTQNCADRLAHGTVARGERHGRSKLTNQQAQEILSRRRAGESEAKLAAEFGVSPTVIGHLVAGRTWAWMQRICSHGENVQ